MDKFMFFVLEQILCFSYCMRKYLYKVTKSIIRESNMNKQEQCLVFPILQKFYSSISCLSNMSPNDYIFENISKIDTFFQEFRNVTFVMQNRFNTPELKDFYARQRDKYLCNDIGRWFNDARVSVTHQQPFKLEKLVTLTVYDSLSFEEFVTVLTTDKDKNLEDISIEIQNLLKQKYPTQSEIYYSIFVSFLKNGEKIDIFDKIIPGILSMWDFISNVRASYPCDCDKCNRLIKMITEKITAIIYRYRLISFVQDCYSHQGKVEFAIRMETIGSMDKGISDGKHPRIKLSESPGFGECFCKDDISLLIKWAINFLALCQIQMDDGRKEPFISPQFMIVFDDGTAEFQGMYNSTVRTTHYRKVNEIADRIQKENIKAVLYTCEAFTYPINSITPEKGSHERQAESDNTTLYNLIVSKNLKHIVGIEFDYSKITDEEYLKTQISNPKAMNFFMLMPILKALKTKYNKDDKNV